jgi:hypothetical protein
MLQPFARPCDHADPSLSDLNWTERSWQRQQAYSDSKLHNVLLAFAIPSRRSSARNRPNRPPRPRCRGRRRSRSSDEAGPAVHSWEADLSRLRGRVGDQAPFFAPPFCFAHLRFWAAAILARASGLKVRFFLGCFMP